MCPSDKKNKRKRQKKQAEATKKTKLKRQKKQVRKRQKKQIVFFVSLGFFCPYNRFTHFQFFKNVVFV